MPICRDIINRIVYYYKSQMVSPILILCAIDDANGICFPGIHEKKLKKKKINVWYDGPF